MAFQIHEMLVTTVDTNVGGGPHVLLFWINVFLMEQMLFKAFKSPPLKILCCHLAKNPVIKNNT